MADLWPETQTTTLAIPPLAIADRAALEPAEYNDYVGDAMARTGIGGLEDIDDINFMCMPDLMKAWDKEKNGDKVGAEADLTAARRINPNIGR